MKIHRVFLILCFLLSGVRFADAHAFLDHADPKVGSRVQVSPAQVKVWFTQKLVATFCNLQVFDEAGKEVDKHDRKLDSADQTLLIISVPALKPGKYKVLWRATSVDTHVTNGDFTFEVTL